MSLFPTRKSLHELSHMDSTMTPSHLRAKPYLMQTYANANKPGGNKSTLLSAVCCLCFSVDAEQASKCIRLISVINYFNMDRQAQSRDGENYVDSGTKHLSLLGQS